MYNVDLKGCGMGVTQEVVFVQGLRMLGLLSASTAASDFAEGFSEHFKGNPQLNCTLDSVLKISGVHTYIDFFSERMLKMKNRP